MQKVDWLDKPYYSLNAYFKHIYGQKIYKIAVSAGLTCPNRDGTLDDRGCIFCSAGGSGDFAVQIGNGVYKKEYGGREGQNRRVLDVTRQIERGMAKFNKSVGERFVIYFQAYTNTYGDTDYLRQIWTAAMSHESVAGISVATRPDCLGEAVLDLLSELMRKYCGKGKFIWVELGLQTIHEDTAKYIRRHYELSVYEEAVRRLAALGIPYITHIILGLPGESREMMLETVRYVNRGQGAELRGDFSKPFGIKLQLLHVLKGTDLAADYEAGAFTVMEQEEYIALVAECLRNISPDVVIHRVTGDGPKRLLLAPLWSGNKKAVLNMLHGYMRGAGVRQGDLSGNA